MRLVLDTNVVVTALRSPTGASAALLDRALGGDFTILLTVALVLEYEAACSQPAQRAASGLSVWTSGSCGVRSFVIRRTRWCWKQLSMGERMRL